MTDENPYENLVKARDEHIYTMDKHKEEYCASFISRWGNIDPRDVIMHFERIPNGTKIWLAPRNEEEKITLIENKELKKRIEELEKEIDELDTKNRKLDDQVSSLIFEMGLIQDKLEGAISNSNDILQEAIDGIEKVCEEIEKDCE